MSLRLTLLLTIYFLTSSGGFSEAQISAAERYRKYAMKRLSSFVTVFAAAIPRMFPRISGLPQELLEDIVKHLHVEAGYYANYDGYKHQNSFSDDNWICLHVNKNLPPALKPTNGYPCHVAFNHILVPTLSAPSPIYLYVRPSKVVVHYEQEPVDELTAYVRTKNFYNQPEDLETIYVASNIKPTKTIHLISKPPRLKPDPEIIMLPVKKDYTFGMPRNAPGKVQVHKGNSEKYINSVVKVSSVPDASHITSASKLVKNTYISGIRTTTRKPYLYTNPKTRTTTLTPYLSKARANIDKTKVSDSQRPVPSKSETWSQPHP